MHPLAIETIAYIRGFGQMSTCGLDVSQQFWWTSWPNCQLIEVYFQSQSAISILHWTSSPATGWCNRTRMELTRHILLTMANVSPWAIDLMQWLRSFAYAHATVRGSNPATAHIGRPHSLWRAALETVRNTISLQCLERLSPLHEHMCGKLLSFEGGDWDEISAIVRMPACIKIAGVKPATPDDLRRISD